MPLIEVLRDDPPALARCKAEKCSAPIEWVTTVKGERRMPVRAPMTVVRVHARSDGRLVTVIDSVQTHFADCKGPRTGARLMPRYQQRQARRGRSSQRSLF